MYQKIIHKRYQGRRLRILFLLAFLFLASACILWYFASDYFSEANDYDQILKEAADRHCVDYLLVKAVIWKESRFNSLALGSKGEIGLMQIRPATAVIDWAHDKNISPPAEASLFSPRLNVEIGTWYLAQALRKWRKYKDFNAMALAEYNAGNSSVQKWKPDSYEENFIDKIRYVQTKNYVTDILRKYEEYAVKREAK